MCDNLINLKLKKSCRNEEKSEVIKVELKVKCGASWSMWYW